jgi:hypothetical protein
MPWISTLTQRRYDQAERLIFFKDETLAYAALGISLRAATGSMNLDRW